MRSPPASGGPRTTRARTAAADRTRSEQGADRAHGRAVAEHVGANKMTCKNLAIVLTPNLYVVDTGPGCNPMEALVMSKKSGDMVEKLLLARRLVKQSLPAAAGGGGGVRRRKPGHEAGGGSGIGVGRGSTGSPLTGFRPERPQRKGRDAATVWRAARCVVGG